MNVRQAKHPPMRVTCVGGGPAGLYFAMLAKKRFPQSSVDVFERNRADDTFGWGVVFSDATLEGLRVADEPTHAAITRAFAHWDDIDIRFKGERIVSGGHGFSGIARKELLRILQERAREVVAAAYRGGRFFGLGHGREHKLSRA